MVVAPGWRSRRPAARRRRCHKGPWWRSMASTRGHRRQAAMATIIPPITIAGSLMKELSTEVFAEGFVFLEGPRWRDHRLWVSDMHGHTVYRLQEDGMREAVVEVPGKPSGIGFLPDGTPLIVSMHDRRLMKLVDGKLTVHADLAALCPYEINDMVVDGRGNAYVGNIGFDLQGGEKFKPTNFVLVTPSGQVREVANDLH